VNVGADFVADAEAFVLVEPGEAAFDDPTVCAEAGAVGDAAAGDHRPDASGPQQPAVLVVVVAAVGEEPSGAAQRPADPATDGRDRVEQRDELGDVVAVPAGQGDRDRGAVGVGDQVMLGAGPATVDRRRARLLPPLRARTWEESTAAVARSRSPLARSSESSAACRRGHTPASVQSRSRRQQVIPEQPTTDAGTARQVNPVRRTNTMPPSAVRSSTRRRPGYRNRRAGTGGSSGATRSHNASGTRSVVTAAGCPNARLRP